MARRRDNRSPSPAGLSRRNGRRDDIRPRDRRDEGRLSSYRSRSPPDEHPRYRDRGDNRDSHRRGDRRDDDSRLDRRERSRDRYRSPDRVPGRDRRDRSRDRNRRDRRENSRDRAQRQPANGARDDRRPVDAKKPAPTQSGSVKDTTSHARDSSDVASRPKQSKEEKTKVDRLAKLEAWKQKQKQAAERERKKKEEDEAQSGQQHDARVAADGAVDTPKSEMSTNSPAPASPVPYAGKFDPKAIAKRAAPSSGSAGALGDDLPVFKKHKSAAAPDATLAKPNDSKPNLFATKPSTVPKSSQIKGHVGAFGLANKVGVDNAPSKQTLDFGDEESTRKKLERLPTPPPEASKNNTGNLSNRDGQVNSTAAAPHDEEDDDDDDDDDEGLGTAENEEEEAAAARAAAEKREERLLADSQAQQRTTQDVTMTDVPEKEQRTPEDGEDEVDPLDAYMMELTAAPAKKDQAPGLGSSSGPKHTQYEPEAMFSDDEDQLSTIKDGTDDMLEMAAIKAARRKKDIPTVDHSKMDYDPFQKNFYAEPSEIANLSEGEVADLRLELDGIKVRGLDVPKPIRSWAQCGLGVATLEVVRKLGYEAPTSIQAQALPVIMSGRDIIGVAKTGSGKTMAFLLPMFRHIKAQRPVEGLDGPIGLIIAPTRELATQIHKDCKPFVKALNLRAVCAYGGAPIKDQIAELKRGAEIVVCTAGRLIDLLAANSGRVTNLRRVTYAVLDEADRMFDMGFEPQIMKIMSNIRPQRQTVLFSATFPRNMEALARKTLQKPVEIIVGGRSVVAPEITQLVEVRPENAKFVRLLQLLGQVHEDEDARSLVFVDRQESAEELMSAVLKRGYPCFTIHGGKDQYDRDTVIADFKAGIFPVLVATSVAARGLDVKQLKMVVNFDCPNHLEDYVHRAGRTGRAGQKGLAVTFITEEQGRYAMDVARALKQSGQDVPEAVQKLVDEFIEKVKSGKEKASFGAGFGGKGLERLDADRDAARNRERKLFKTGDEPDEQDEKDTKEAKAKDEIVIHSTKGPDTVSADKVSKPAPQQTPSMPNIDLDGHITVHKNTSAEESAAAAASGKINKVEAAVARINSRLRKTGDIRGNAPIDNKGPDAGLFHATLEINDFPQKARWACTNRTNVARILGDTGTSITTKGQFYAPGAPPPGPTDKPKLYVLVEGDTELAVTSAMRELMRSLKEGLAAAEAHEARAPASGRYSVV